MIKELGGFFRHFLPHGKNAQEKLRNDHYFVEMDFLRKAVDRVRLDENSPADENATAAKWCQIARWIDESKTSILAPEDMKQTERLADAVRVISHVIGTHKGDGPIAIEKSLIWDISTRVALLHECESFHGKGVRRWSKDGNVAYMMPRGDKMRRHFDESRNYFDDQRDALRTRPINSKEVAFLTPPNEGVQKHFDQMAKKIDYSTPPVFTNPEMGYICDAASAVRRFCGVVTDYLRAHPDVDRERTEDQQQKAVRDMEREQPIPAAATLSPDLF